MKKLNTADWFSIYRILAVPVIVFVIFSDRKELAGWLLLVSFLTDAIDGFIARNWNMQTVRGANLDSVGDALTFTAGVVGLVHFNFDFILEYKWIIGIAVGLYLLQIFIALIKYGRTTSFHTYMAKTAAVLQAIFLVVFHLQGVVLWLFWIGIIVSIMETVEEIILIFMFREWKTDVKGIYWVLKDNRGGE